MWQDAAGQMLQFRKEGLRLQHRGKTQLPYFRIHTEAGRCDTAEEQPQSPTAPANHFFFPHQSTPTPGLSPNMDIQNDSPLWHLSPLLPSYSINCPLDPFP